MNILCTICSDIINQAENIFVTKCGHLFHHPCLAQWIERSNTCPQCRAKVSSKCMFRLYPTISNEQSAEDAVMLQSRLDDVSLQLREQGFKVKNTEEKYKKIKTELKHNQELLKLYEEKLVNRDSAISGLKQQLEYVKIQNRETQHLKAENESLSKNIQLLNGLQKVLNATSEEVEELLQGYTDVRTVATFATALKKALCESESKKNEIRDRLHSTKAELGTQKKRYTMLQQELTQTKSKLFISRKKLKAMKKENSDHKETEMVNLISDDSMSILPTRSDNFWLNENNNSVASMVNRIQGSNSPYLNLKQSSLALSALQRVNNVPMDKIKPSERLMLDKIKSGPNSFLIPEVPKTSSIFQMKSSGISPQKSSLNLNTSYDGLGGHSKLDRFPEKQDKPIRSIIPKVTAKHKLKRPNPGGIDISKMLKKTK